VGELDGIVSRAREGVKASEGILGNGRVGGIFRFKGALGKDRDELVDGTGAGEGAGMAVGGEVMADTGERLVKVEWV
jgi:hypothetical protein